MKNNAFQGIGGKIVQGTGSTLLFVGLARLIFDIYHWNYAQRMGSSNISIPTDINSGISFLVLAIIILLLHHFWSQICNTAKSNKVAFSIGTILVSTLLFIGGNALFVASNGGVAISAAMSGDTEKLRQLFEKGEVKEKDYDQMMIWGAQRGHAETVELMIKKGLNPNAKREDGVSALESACLWGGNDTVTILKKAGAVGQCAQ